MNQLLPLSLLFAVINAGGSAIATCELQSTCLKTTVTQVSTNPCLYDICLVYYDGGCECNADGTACSCGCNGCSCDCQEESAGSGSYIAVNKDCKQPSHVCCKEGGDKKITECNGTPQEAFCCSDTCSALPKCCDPEDPETLGCTEPTENCDGPPQTCDDPSLQYTSGCDGSICCQRVAGGEVAAVGFKDGSTNCCELSDGTPDVGCKAYDLDPDPANAVMATCDGPAFQELDDGSVQTKVCGDNLWKKKPPQTMQNECRWRITAPNCDCTDDLICPTACPSSAKFGGINTDKFMSPNHDWPPSYNYHDLSNETVIIIVVCSVLFGLFCYTFGVFVYFKFKYKIQQLKGIVIAEKEFDEN